MHGRTANWLAKPDHGTCRVFRALLKTLRIFRACSTWSGATRTTDGTKVTRTQTAGCLTTAVSSCCTHSGCQVERCRVTNLEVVNFACLCTDNDADPDILQALRQLLTTPGALGNLEQLKIGVHCDWACADDFNLVGSPVFTACRRCQA